MVKKEMLCHGWFLGLILVVASNFILYNTTIGISILPDEPNGVVIGSMIDLAVVAPLLFLAWKRKWSWKYIIASMATGLIIVRFFIPMEYLAPFEMVTWIGFAVESVSVLAEILILFTMFKYMPNILLSVRVSDLPVVFSFSKAVQDKVKKNPIVQVLLNEMLIFYYAFASWKKRTILRENEFTIHHQSSFIALRIMFIHALILETAAIHWMLHDQHFVLAMILLVLDVYAVIFFIADTQAVRLNPLKITADRLYISFGLMKRIEIKWTDIEEIIEEPQILREKRSKDTIEFVARDFEDTYPTVILKLKHSVAATLVMGMRKRYEKVAIKVDNPESFKKLLQENL